jgi:hypothetical protein
MASPSQQLVGITNMVFDENGKPTDKRYCFWDCDMEHCTYEQMKKVLRKMQVKYHLSDICLTTDNNGKTYRAWCWSIVTEDTMLKILIDSKSIIDRIFFFYTMKRGEATLRTGTKGNRPFQRCTDVIESFYLPPPSKIARKVTYVTGAEKGSVSMRLGVGVD